MKQSDASYAAERLQQLKSNFGVDIDVDWKDDGGIWQPGYWHKQELDDLLDALHCFADYLGGTDKFCRCTGGVKVLKTNIGKHGGEARAHEVKFATEGFSPWTVVHEFAHAWDANKDWKVSRLMERYTGGFSSPLLSKALRVLKLSDTGPDGEVNQPGRHGRKPGCNAAGYYYGDKPSGSNWNFNRIEDFAESVAMYVGWGGQNKLSEWAHRRVDRYLKPDGTDIPDFGRDNWTYYKKYFYPEGGDYTKTKRWQFIDGLVKGIINV